MMDGPITCMEDALLRALNAARINRDTLHELMDDTGQNPDYESMAAVEEAEEGESAAMAYLVANAPKCPGCKQAFAFQRQAKRPKLCSYCGYDHETGESPVLVPA